MTHAVTDTHGLIWYLEDSPLLGAEASQVFDACAKGEISVYIPTICLVEIVYLQEKGRISQDNLQQLQDNLVVGHPYFKIVDLNLDIVMKMREISRDTVPDMPDRIIVATSLYLNLPLISRDQKIQLSQVETIW